MISHLYTMRIKTAILSIPKLFPWKWYQRCAWLLQWFYWTQVECNWLFQNQDFKPVSNHCNCKFTNKTYKCIVLLKNWMKIWYHYIQTSHGLEFMCVFVCVCVCVRACACVCVRVPVCVRVRVQLIAVFNESGDDTCTDVHAYIHICTHIHIIYIYTYIWHLIH